MSAETESSTLLSTTPLLLLDSKEVLNVNVGVLGHVDSGKTSLVKRLSTLLSTAALDKSTESRQRGMTLDLGFSCFFLDMPQHLQSQFPEKKQLQMTLVDCPGHASLIRTIIGGAQIIDMVLLVVDAYKGWQAQTTECLVLAELTSPHLVVALNKVDMYPPEQRDAQILKAKALVRERLKGTRFAMATMVGVSACVGGERFAAVDGDASMINAVKNETLNVDTLIKVLQEKLPPPRRTNNGPFYFSIDHCFPIKGMGTVMTGTVLNGSASVNDMVEFPTLGLERKIKSIQMFKRKVKSIQQGDRAGVCVSSFDANLLERGVASAPGAVQLLKGAIALVRKIKYFPGPLPGGSKFHISVGHTTIMATVTFWGARELAEKQLLGDPPESKAEEEFDKDKKKKERIIESSSLGGDADRAGLPYLSFDFKQDFLHQDGLIESLDENTTKQKKDSEDALLHWAMLDFQTPVYCPLNSLVIGSRLDTVDDRTGSSSSCRLAFCGRLIQKLDPEKEASQIRLYTPKERRGVISRLGDAHRRQDDDTMVRYEVFGSDLFKKETIMKPFVGMKLVTEKGEIGEIKSSFGTTGKFRVFFPAGTEAREGDPLILKFKRFAHDPEKRMRQDLQLPAARSGARVEIVKKTKRKPEKVGEVVTLKGDILENGKHSTAIIAGFFTPEINIREKVGRKVFIPSTNEEGTIEGPFGKAGKCKVAFEDGISAPVGAKAELHHSDES
jgi:selenocysteine-specific elongation factor